MRKSLLSLLFFISISTYSQVGIGTTSPTAQLDVKGDFKVRTTAWNSGVESAQDSVLVVNAGLVNRVTSKQIYDSHIKSFVKGTTNTGTNTLGVAIGSTGYDKIPFAIESLDKNNDYDSTAAYEFTAPKDGIYSVYVLSNLYAAISVSSVGVAIFSKHGSDAAKLEGEEVSGSISLFSSTTRRTQTLVQLSAGDKLFFGATSGLSVTVISGTKSFFTIMQVE